MTRVYKKIGFIFQTRKSREEKSGKIQIHNIVLNFPAVDFLVCMIKEYEIQNSFCRSLPYFSIYPGFYECAVVK